MASDPRFLRASIILKLYYSQSEKHVLTNTHYMRIVPKSKPERTRTILKTKDLVDLLKRNGWRFKRNGANHDIYVKDGKRESVVRHNETDEDLAKAIIKRNNLK